MIGLLAMTAWVAIEHFGAGKRLALIIVVSLQQLAFCCYIWSLETAQNAKTTSARLYRMVSSRRRLVSPRCQRRGDVSSGATRLAGIPRGGMRSVAV